jgi:hypothetical protein
MSYVVVLEHSCSNCLSSTMCLIPWLHILRLTCCIIPLDKHKKRSARTWGQQRSRYVQAPSAYWSWRDHGRRQTLQCTSKTLRVLQRGCQTHYRRMLRIRAGGSAGLARLTPLSGANADAAHGWSGGNRVCTMRTIWTLMERKRTSFDT